MKLRSFLLLFFVGLSFALSAQTISVKSFKLLPTDMTASSLEGKRLDQNNEVAALIRVVTSETDFSFEAGALGIVDTKQKVGEIWVWVPRGSRKISIMHQKLGVLREYRYPIEIEAERTYEMQLTTGKVIIDVAEEIQQQYLTFQISPSNAVLEVNGQLWEVGADGSSTKFVDFGTYKYRVQAPNYHSDAGVVTVNDSENAQKVNVTLKPDFVEVTLKTDMDAEIWVNNEKKGVGSWTGTLGKGTYKIECKKVNHETSVLSQEVTDALDGQTITLPAPKPIYGSLNIESTPNYATVFIDGKAVGETPKFVKEILVGTHEIKVRKDGHNDYVETATITKGERKQLKIILEEKDAETKGKELAWKNSFFPIFADKGEPFYYEIGLWDDDGPDTETEHKYKDINGKTYPDGILFAHNQRLAVEENGKWMIYSVDGKKIGPFDGLPDLHLCQQQDTIKILKDGKCGLIDKDGNQLIPPIYENLEAFKNLQEMISPQLYMAEKNGKMGVINIHNDIVEPFEFTPSWRSVYDFVVEKDGKYGCLDALTGKLLIPCRYKYIKTKGDIIIVQNEEDRWEVYNREGKLIHPFKYSYISDRESSGMIYKLDKEKNGISSLMNSKGKIIANDCCALGIILEQFDLFLYCRWTNKEKDEKEWCLTDINTGEVKSVIDPRIAEDLGLKTKGGGWRTAWQGRYFIGSKNKNTYEEEQGVWDLFTQKLVIPYSLGKIHVEYNDSNEIVSCTRYSDQDDNNTPYDITFYSFPEGKVKNSYKDVIISGFPYFSENGMYRWNYVIMYENDKGLVVDDFGNPIISCECWNDGEGNPCYNLCRTGHYILDSNKGVYDTNGNLLIEGKYGDILENNDLKCIVLYRLGDSRKTGKNRECYVFENGKLKQVEDKGSLSELVFSVIQQKCQ